MRAVLLLVLSLLPVGVVTDTAAAETKLSPRIVGGLGWGAGHHQGLDHGGGSYLVAADLLWRRRRSDRSLMLSIEAGGVVGGGARLLGGYRVWPVGGSPAARNLDLVRHGSILLGLERSRAGPGFGPYLHGGVGMGLVTTAETSQETTAGLALGGGAGFRLVSPARELGLSLGLRTSHVIARGARSHFLALTFGAAINPR